jgi:hypothetical protein
LNDNKKQLQVTNNTKYFGSIAVNNALNGTQIMGLPLKHLVIKLHVIISNSVSYDLTHIHCGLLLYGVIVTGQCSKWQ